MLTEEENKKVLIVCKDCYEIFQAANFDPGHIALVLNGLFVAILMQLNKESRGPAMAGFMRMAGSALAEMEKKEEAGNLET